MTSISALENVYKKGLFGDYEDKNENKLIKIKERKNLLIVQIVQYKKSFSSTKDIKIDDLNLNDEVLKKGCPFNFNELKKNNCVNSVFNGITITIDMIDGNSDTIRLFALRSFGESLYHSITDACLEFGYKSL